MISNNETKRVDNLIGASALSSPKLKEHKAIRELSEALGVIKKSFLYGSLRGSVLTFYFNHPGAVSEFNMQKESILEKMRSIYKEKRLKDSIVFNSVNASFVAKHSFSEEKKSKSRNIEIARGEFEVQCKNPELKKIFESIKMHIRLNSVDARGDDV